MPLDAPNLDDRLFDDIVREAQLRIARYTPEWTDFNHSDPGMTLVQLFAWLTETMLYRMNQVPDRLYLKFLELIDLQPTPAMPAQAQLTFEASKDAQENPLVRARSQVLAQAVSPDGEPLIFETIRDLALVRWPLEDLLVVAAATTQIVSVAAANASPGSTFLPFGWDPQVDDALYLGFKPPEVRPGVPLPAEPFPREISLHLCLPFATTPAKARNANVAAQPPSPPVDLAWEYLPNALSMWRYLNAVDDTAAFTREGYIRLSGPTQIEPVLDKRLSQEPRYWLRVRLAAHSYPVGQAPRVDFLRPNSVPAEHRTSVRGEVVGSGTGLANQTLTLQHRSVDKTSIELSIVGDDGQAESWAPRDDLLASDRPLQPPNDRVFALDPNAGVLTFGDGDRGRVPGAGARIAATYRYGGGAAGNVGPNQLTTLLATTKGVAKVTNIRPAVGGADTQTVEDLKRQAPARLRTRNRAVTQDDFESLAKEVGGVAMAKAIPLAHPSFPGLSVPGAITVVIAPRNDDVRDPKPSPSPGQIDVVSRHMNECRLLGTELFVKGPDYRGVRVEVRVTAVPFASADAVKLDVQRAIDDYLDPLGRRAKDQAGAGGYDAGAGAPYPSSDDERRGWEIGEALVPLRLYAAILAVQSVATIVNLQVSVNGVPVNDLRVTQTIPADGLIYGERDGHIIAVDATAARTVGP